MSYFKTERKWIKLLLREVFMPLYCQLLTCAFWLQPCSVGGYNCILSMQYICDSAIFENQRSYLVPLKWESLGKKTC